MGARIPIQIGETHNSPYGKFTVIEEVSNINYRKKFKIRFHETDNEMIVDSTRIRSGNVYDNFARTIAGVGRCGNVEKPTAHKLYYTWRAMLSRCYSPTQKAYKHYGAKGVYVDERWHLLENFLNDVKTLEGWSEELHEQGKLVLDKDTKSGKDKRYSPETCIWLTRAENAKLSAQHQMHAFIATSPEGVEYESDNQREFAWAHGLTPQKVSEVLRGKHKATKGWTFKYKEKE